MSEISRTALFGKLNGLAYRAIEAATVYCKLRGNPYLELAHWLHQLLQLQDSDLQRIIAHFDLDPALLARDLTAALDGLPRGSTAIFDLSPQLEDAVERAWVYASLLFGESQVRTGHLLVGLLKTRSLRHALLGLSKEFAKVQGDRLSDDFRQIVDGSGEDGLAAHDGWRGELAPGESSGAMAPAQLGGQEALRRFTVDMTAQAASGQMDPIVGRDAEIRQLIDILMRRRQNNPMLTGEAGVGKTAVAEGLAQRIAAGDVPPALRSVALRTLDVGLLQAGASMKGEFEQRLRQVIEEVQSSEKPIILFIDEAHTLVGAGGAAGTGDAANLLKPALARGSLRTVAATTWVEYKRHIEKDPALTRRFQVVQVAEPSEAQSLQMLRSLADVLEQHHQVQLLDAALAAAVKLSHRYIPARQLPDKAVSLLDTACARVAVSQHATPAAVEDAQHRVQALERESVLIAREEAVGIDGAQRRAAVEQQLQAQRASLAELEARWRDEQGLVEEILAVRAQLRRDDSAAAGDDGESTGPARAERLARLGALQQQLRTLQGECPLLLPTVDEQAVASVVQDWTGIPVGRMVKNEVATVLHLADIMERRIVGQRHALEMIARRIQTARASLDNPDKPIGVFLLAGTSGVGKTETALALAEALYGGEQQVITFNMSEFQEAHTVSTLKGAPPGYVGYGEGGVLTEAVRRRPYSVLLLDEVEKAHPDVHELFFQVFDKGWMEDGEGRVIDFRNTLILLTSNVGSELISGLCRDVEQRPPPEQLTTALREALLQVFPAALLGRLVVIPFYPLGDEVIAAIARLQLARVEHRVAENHGITFSYDDAVIELIAARCKEVESGGRMIDAILTNTVLPTISQVFLSRMLAGEPVPRIHVGVAAGEFHFDYGAAELADAEGGQAPLPCATPSATQATGG